ncbi:MAG: ABC transporter ATP-binding protein [Chloroflexota bacterium]|nr:ABC transporter ATP-binding protein [Chloroflexota bacterium]
MTQASAIQLDGLTKVFGRRKKIYAVRDVSLNVAPGQVYGFLGPNGAGKTTTIRMLLSLMTPSAGRLSVFGKDIHHDPTVLRRVGAHIEGAAFYPYLSGRRNLEVIGRINGFYDRERIETLLKQVGLSERARQRVRGYSLGMRQRLGLAAALVNSPDLLIMDEPTNGLDPAGIQEMREFMRELVDQDGKTVFFSSHLLSEVEQTCDRVAIINRGEIVREGAVKALLESGSSVRIEVASPVDAAAALGDAWQSRVAGGALVVDAPRAHVPRIVARLVERDIAVYEVVREKQTLEAFFLDVTHTASSDVSRMEIAHGR